MQLDTGYLKQGMLATVMALHLAGGARAADGLASPCELRTRGIVATEASTDGQVAALGRLSNECQSDEFFASTHAFRLSMLGRFEESLRLAEKALPSAQRYRDNLRATLISNKAGLGRSDEAYSDAIRFAKESPRFASFRFLLARMDADRKQWASAQAHITEAIAIDRDPTYLMLRATFRYQQKDLQGTVADVHEALLLDPARVASPGGLIEGLYALVILGRTDEAKELLVRHKKANPQWQHFEPMARIARELER
jgi:tetratricopeptide (TPR) repeat protein